MFTIWGDPFDLGGVKFQARTKQGQKLKRKTVSESITKLTQKWVVEV